MENSNNSGSSVSGMGNSRFIKSQFCYIHGCDNKVKAFGLCSKHYQRVRKHGFAELYSAERHGKSKTPEYKTWCYIKSRCYNKNVTGYENYGGRGIEMCDEWKSSFPQFLSDMGEKPFKKAQIDRIDNEKGYSLENCRWASVAVNSRNRRSTKLSVQKVIEIKTKYNSGKYTKAGLGREYNVTDTHIGKIISGEKWSGV